MLARPDHAVTWGVHPMTLDTAIARFRRRQQDLFRDEAILLRPATSGVLDPGTDAYTPNAATVVYSGPCLFQPEQLAGTDAVIGDEQVRKRRTRVTFPADTDIHVDDVVAPSKSTYDSSLVEATFRVTDVLRDGWQIARVVIVEEVIE